MDTYTKKLLEDKSIEERTDSLGNTYRIRVLGRGQNLFFQENNLHLFCQIDAVDAIIFRESIKKWDNIAEFMDKREQERVCFLILKYYREVYNPDVTVE